MNDLIPKNYTCDPWDKVLDTHDLLTLWAAVVICIEILVVGAVAIGAELFRQWGVL